MRKITVVLTDESEIVFNEIMYSLPKNQDGTGMSSQSDAISYALSCVGRFEKEMETDIPSFLDAIFKKDEEGKQDVEINLPIKNIEPGKGPFLRKDVRTQDDILLSVLESAKILGLKARTQYIDYAQNQWTVPEALTNDLVIKLCNDASVGKIELVTNSVQSFDKVRRIYIDQKPFDIIGIQFISGSKILELAKVPKTYGIYMVNPGNNFDKFISNTDLIDLAEDDIKTFFTASLNITEG